MSVINKMTKKVRSLSEHRVKKDLEKQLVEFRPGSYEHKMTLKEMKEQEENIIGNYIKEDRIEK